ncbi:DnaJ C-terminal domain-containing protein [Enterocloster sp.]|uniref:DnaJ C-terminal domain-containing protein n=1 Tax=Enterocloster sp. TaxID=2719315 RepID=UPI001748CC70
MDQKRDYYEVLGIERTADSNTIKKAYRKLAKQYHPDTNKGDPRAEEKFKEATEAYAVLSDPEKRKQYDRFGFAQEGTDGGYQEYHFENGDFDDILKDLFGGGFGGRFHTGGFHRGFGYRERAWDGEDLNAEIEIHFMEAVNGCEKTIRLTGEEGKQTALKVQIPAGIDTGKTIRLRGKGHPGQGGGRPGDLLLTVQVREMAGVERKDLDIYTTAQIPFTTAVLGGEAVIRTLSGQVLCRISPGTQSGTKIRLRGKGIVSMKDPRVYGDQYATVQIDVPRNLSPEAEKKLKEFESLLQGRRGGGAA